MIKGRAKNSPRTKPAKGKAKAKPGLVAKTKAGQRKRVHRVARGKPKPGHIVGHSRRRRKGEILCHNHVLHTAATANGVHGSTGSQYVHHQDGTRHARSGKSAHVGGVRT
jgi:hypothetical protein